MSEERMNDSLTRRILKLRAESYGAGDHSMGDICDIALGHNDETVRWSRDNAIAECERVLADAEAQS